MHYLGLIEERAIGIVSNYNRLQSMTDSVHKNGSSFTCRNSSRRVSINPPRLLDYSSDENSDEGDDASSCQPRPVNIKDLDYSKLASRAEIARERRKTLRRGSLIFGGRASMAKRMSVAFGPNGNLG